MPPAKYSRLFLLSLPYLVLMGLCALLLLKAYQLCEGHMIYPLDDAYIHMSLVKQLMETGDWALSPGKFHSSSSSPLFILLLFLGRLIYSGELLPLFINILGAVLFVRGIQYFLEKESFSSLFVAAFSVGIIFLTPLHLLILSGMEHVWQCLFACSYLYFVRKYLISHDKEGVSFSDKDLLYLCLSGLLLSGFRYEGIFLISSSALIFLVNKQYRIMIISSLSAAVPVLTYGIFSLSKGAFFFPNSLLIKGHLPTHSFDRLVRWAYRFIETLYENPFVWVSFLLLAGILLFPRLKGSTKQMVLIVLLSFMLHVLLAEIGGYRYEAYLVLLTLLSLVWIKEDKEMGAFLKELFVKGRTQKWAYATFVLLIVFPFCVRSAFFTLNYPVSSKNIYEQQYQMARFLQKYYPIASVGANDVGAITYFTNIQLLDLVGIGSQEILRLRRAGTWDADHIEELAQESQLEIVICYDSWVKEKLPATWKRVATWTIEDNFICGDEQVSFYGTTEVSSKQLLENLRAFEHELPQSVHKGY